VAAQTVKENEKAAKPADPTKVGFSFAGWFSDSALTKAYDFDAPVTQDLLLYAKWKPIGNYTVTFETFGGSEVAPRTVTEGQKLAKPVDPSRGADRFFGWFTDSELITDYDFSEPVTGDLTLYALWLDHFWLEWIEENETIKDSWEEIFKAEADGTYKTKYKIGDTKFMYFSPGPYFIGMQIAAFDADPLADGSGTAPISWVSTGFLIVGHRMSVPSADPKAPGEGSFGGWEYSEMRSWLNETFLPFFPQPVRKAIKPVTKYSSYFDVEAAEAAEDYDHLYIVEQTTTDEIWIPSFREVFGAMDDVEGGFPLERIGPTYTELFRTNADRLRENDAHIAADWWWLRSGNNDTRLYLAVDHHGECTSWGTEKEGGVVIGFCT
ncbi:MAG: InlB B-repeat-containing protein, partial [Lachnospiraceae bacterium]|nr:InlB B-repeat-containing protein [Lachnospiraceae bacterium]